MELESERERERERKTVKTHTLTLITVKMDRTFGQNRSPPFLIPSYTEVLPRALPLTRINTFETERQRDRETKRKQRSGRTTGKRKVNKTKPFRQLFQEVMFRQIKQRRKAVRGRVENKKGRNFKHPFGQCVQNKKKTNKRIKQI